MSEAKIHPESKEYPKEEIQLKIQIFDKGDNKTAEKSESKLYISEPSESDDSFVSDNIDEPSKKRTKIDIPKCPGCYPVFQPNQLGHIGPNGCLGDEF